MSNFYQVTLNQGRTDTVNLEASSVADLRIFLESLTTANITSIKRIVFSRDLGIGSGVSNYIPNNQDNYLNVLVKNDLGFTGTLNISFPSRNITLENISKSIKKYLLLNNRPIIEIINILKCNEGGSPNEE